MSSPSTSFTGVTKKWRDAIGAIDWIAQHAKNADQHAILDEAWKTVIGEERTLEMPETGVDGTADDYRLFLDVCRHLIARVDGVEPAAVGDEEIAAFFDRVRDQRRLRIAAAAKQVAIGKGTPEKRAVPTEEKITKHERAFSSAVAVVLRGQNPHLGALPPHMFEVGLLALYLSSKAHRAPQFSEDIFGLLERVYRENYGYWNSVPGAKGRLSLGWFDGKCVIFANQGHHADAGVTVADTARRIPRDILAKFGSFLHFTDALTKIRESGSLDPRGRNAVHLCRGPTESQVDRFTPDDRMRLAKVLPGGIEKCRIVRSGGRVICQNSGDPPEKAASNGVVIVHPDRLAAVPGIEVYQAPNGVILVFGSVPVSACTLVQLEMTGEPTAEPPGDTGKAAAAAAGAGAGAAAGAGAGAGAAPGP